MAHCQGEEGRNQVDLPPPAWVDDFSTAPAHSATGYMTPAAVAATQRAPARSRAILDLGCQ